jgi:DNA-directed RNA polymerase specialized sigma24 family protein
MLVFIRRTAGPKLSGRIEAEDVFQEASIHAMGSIEALRVRDLQGLRNWFRGIIRHRILELIHAARVRIRPRATTPLPDAHLSFRDPVSIPELDVTPPTSEPRDETRNEVHDLRANYRMAMVLHDVFATQWDTVAFVMLRFSSQSARLTHCRARFRLTEGLGAGT